MDSTMGYGVSVETAIVAMFPCSGDAMRMQEESDKFAAMDRALLFEEAEAYEAELERERDTEAFFARIESTYGSMVRELL